MRACVCLGNNRSQQLSLVVKLIPVLRYSDDIFHILVFQEYRILAEISNIPPGNRPVKWYRFA